MGVEKDEKRYEEEGKQGEMRGDELKAGVYDFAPTAWEEVLICLFVDSSPLLV